MRGRRGFKVPFRHGRSGTATVLAASIAGVLAASLFAGSAGAAPGWQLQSSGGSFAQSGLAGVACADASTCEAVGFGLVPSVGPANVTALAEASKGDRWALQRTSEPAPQGELNAVSCTSVRFCMAVGGELAERYNGTSWVATKVRVPGALRGVSCVSASWCVAVGIRLSANSDHTTTLIETWNGRGWTLARGPTTTSTFDGLQAVACRSKDWCVAVGATSDPSTHTSSTLIARWNGADWVDVRSPDPATTWNELKAVSCATTTSCTAVGFGAASESAPGNTLVLTYAGSSWSVVPTPNGGAYGELNGVDCTSATRCVAVGARRATSNAAWATLVEAPTDGTWSVIASPGSPGRWNDVLSAVSCAGTQRCVAVGTTYSTLADDALLLSEG